MTSISAQDTLRNVRLPQNADISVIQAQKLQRLRVNRVAIVQALRVEHILPILMQQGVITEEDKKTIDLGKSVHDKARRLIDILPQKGRDINWYGCFREALKNPDTRSCEAKKKYLVLVEFLDNTILPYSPRIAASQRDPMRLPHYEPLPSINSSDSPVKNRSGSRVTFDLAGSTDNRDMEGETSSQNDDEKGMTDDGIPENYEKSEQSNKSSTMTLIKGYFHKWVPAPENFATLIKEPTEHFKMLLASKEPSDQQQLEQEKLALERVRKLEVVFALNRRGQLPVGMELCMSSAVEDVLADEETCHLYFKYFTALKENYNLDIPAELAGSFYNLTQNIGDSRDDETRENVVKMGFGLFEFLNEYGLYQRAEMVISGLISYLSTNPSMETWMGTWEAYIKLFEIRNTNVNFKEADWVYNQALSVADRIKLMSFGKDLLDESAMYVELSRIMREQGSIAPAFSWAKEALKEVCPSNHRNVVEVLCCASQAYSLHYDVPKAETLAVEAIKQARQHFGTNSPMYVKALLCYCQFSSEFRQDEYGIEVARTALRMSHRLYGGAHLLVAQAHQALARALVVAQQFTDEEYFQEALKAWKMALDVVPGNHPRLATFRYTLGQCLQWRALHGDAAAKQGNLIWAETEAKAALGIFKSIWGEYSLKTAQAHNLLGQIYTKMDRFDDAESMLQGSATLHKLSVPSHSPQMYLMKATLGNFYKSTDKPLEAISLLQDVVDHVECKGVYLKWVHLSYDSLLSLLRALGRDKEAETYQAGLVDWMRTNPKPSHPLGWEQLHAKPQSYDKWHDSFTSAGRKLTKGFKRGMKHVKANMAALGKQ